MDLELQTSLCALTGETGTGKSILLDALGLALGSRAETGFIRPGAEHAHVTAEFDIDGNHPAIITTKEQGLDIQDTLILRRILSRDGKNRATINDQPVSVNFLKKIGSLLVEIQGQSDNHGLLDVNTHISFLDDYSKSNSLAGEVSLAWGALRDAKSSVILAKKEMNIELVDSDSIRGYDAAIVAVGHEIYCNLKLVDWQRMLKTNGVLIDVKSLYDKNIFSGTDIRHWRL